MAITIGEQRALSKAMALELAAQVERVRWGLYRVPSTSEAGVVHTVIVDGGVYECTCKAANKTACVHRAAVYLAKLQATGAKVVGVKPAIRAARQGKPAAAPNGGAESERSAESTGLSCYAEPARQTLRPRDLTHLHRRDRHARSWAGTATDTGSVRCSA